MKIKPKKKYRGEVGCCSKMLSKGTIPQYFYMPITQAAKEPDEGPAPLKKRCREPKVGEPPRKLAYDKADGADGGNSFF